MSDSPFQAFIQLRDNGIGFDLMSDDLAQSDGIFLSAAQV